MSVKDANTRYRIWTRHPLDGYKWINDPTKYPSYEAAISAIRNPIDFVNSGGTILILPASETPTVGKAYK